MFDLSGRRGGRYLLAASISVVGLAIPATASAAPRSGDWEASGSTNAVGSFLVTKVSKKVKGVTQHFMAVEDLVVQAPITCQNTDSIPFPVEVEVIPGVLKLSSSGKFSTGKIRRNNGTVVSGRLSHGRFRITYRHASTAHNAFEGGTIVCKTGTVSLTAKPGHRKAVADGVWIGKVILGEPVEFNVVAGGRALQTSVIRGTTDYSFQVEPDSEFDDCAGSVSTGGSDGSGFETGHSNGATYAIQASVFIAPNGTFSNDLYRIGDSQQVSGAFATSKSASGKFANPPQACGPWGWSAAWS